MESKSIKEYHLFNHQDNWYIINIEEMFADTIDEATAKALKVITIETNTQVDLWMEEQLKKLQLIKTKEEPRPEVNKNRKKELFPIVNMSLFLTQSCNLQCIYCYGGGGRYGTGGNMDENTAFQAVNWQLEQLGEIQKIHIGFFGGEPFLNFPLMKAVVEYTEKRVQEMGKKVEFHTTTNATLLDDEKIAFIKAHQIYVMVSFDGSKEIQDAQRPYENGEGSYDSIVPRIKKLLEAVPETPGHAVIVGNTNPKLVKDAMQEIGFTEVSITPASKSLFTDESDKTKLARDNKQLLLALEEEAKLWICLVKNKDSESLKILKTKSGLYQALISLLHNRKRHYACGAGLGMAAVSVAGDIYLCHRFVGMDEYKLGSVFMKGLDRKEYQKSPLIGDGRCATCFAKYYCAGGCKHDNAGSSGAATMPSKEICQLRCRELELAATITCQLDFEDKIFLTDHEIFPQKPCPYDF